MEPKCSNALIFDPVQPTSYGRFCLSIAQNLGGRRQQEDRLAACPALGDGETAFFGLWDGTVDDFAAEQVKRLVLLKLLASPGWAAYQARKRDGGAATSCQEHLEAGMRDAIIQADEELICRCRETQNHYSSCTGVMVLLADDVLTVASLGDSRATLGIMEDAFLRCEPLTCDHKPDLPAERRRIEEAGGFVAVNGSLGLEHLGAAFIRGGDFDERKARGETPKQLQYSRAFGGKDLKPYGLSNQPDIKQMVLDVRHKVLILASDGLWDVCSEERAVCLAHDVADRGLDPAQALVEQALVENRFLRTRADNITVVAVTFN